jgi:hypothetical protein
MRSIILQNKASQLTPIKTLYGQGQKKKYLSEPKKDRGPVVVQILRSTVLIA